jgi:AcrR family transcriptional regulator
MNGHRTRERLLSGARTAIRRRGYSDATVEDFARAAGFTKGAVYSQFAAKTEVLAALIDSWSRDAAHAIRGHRRGPLVAAAEFAAGRLQRGWQGLLPEFWRQALDDEAARAALLSAYRRLEAAIAGSLAPAVASPRQAARLARETLAIHDGLLARGQARGVPIEVEPEDVLRYLEGASVERRRRPRSLTA